MTIRMERALTVSSVTLGASGDTSRYRFGFEGFTAESGTYPSAPASGVLRFVACKPAAQAEIDHVLAKVDPLRREIPIL